MRLWPRSFTGQLVLTLILALLAAQVLAFVIFAGERARVVRLAYRENIIERTENLVRLLRDVPASAHSAILQTASSRALRFDISSDPVVGMQYAGLRADFLARKLAQELNLAPDKVRVALSEEDADTYLLRPRWRRHHGDDDDDDGRHAPRRLRWLAFSVALNDGAWLNAVTGAAPAAPPFGAAFLTSLLLSTLAVVLTAYVLARRMARPMLGLAAAAEQMGRGEEVAELAVRGPVEVQRSAAAFNEMRARLDRFISDRTKMLAAISHDLRTPITSLRLRAELVEDEEARTKLVETIEEMQQMVEATLDFVRADAGRETTQPTDLRALIVTVADVLAELGHRVEVREGPAPIIAARPMMLRRALRNLMENAVRYGDVARVDIVAGGPDADIQVLIEDEGPGLPEADLEAMFEPFVRGERSRSRETGGVGLGLAIARTIVRRHGGDVRLENRAEGGLRAIVTLPCITS